jgi:hypothetical protein
MTNGSDARDRPAYEGERVRGVGLKRHPIKTNRGSDASASVRDCHQTA